MPPPPTPADAELLHAYLADRDVPCPKCGYNLRGLKGHKCPECSGPVELAVAPAADARTLRVPPRLGAVALATVAAWTAVRTYDMLDKVREGFEGYIPARPRPHEGLEGWIYAISIALDRIALALGCIGLAAWAVRRGRGRAESARSGIVRAALWILLLDVLARCVWLPYEWMDL